MKVLLATPVYGTVEPENMGCIIATMEALRKAGHDNEWFYTQATPISVARDLIANSFLYGDGFKEYDALAQFDADHTWKAKDVVASIEAMQPGPIDVLGFSYVTRAPQLDVQQGFVSPKMGGAKLVKYVNARGQVFAKLPAGGYVGGGILIVTRAALERLAETAVNARAPEAGGQQLKRFFLTRWPETGEDCGEDIYFCDQWQRAGGTVYCNLSAVVGHIGKSTFNGHFPTWARYNGLTLEEEA